MSIIKIISQAWSWTGINPEKVIGKNHFGNLMVKDTDGKFWRICPEELYCEVIAESKEELDVISKDQDFLEDWHMRNLVELAETRFGELEDDRNYCFVTPGSLGGEYGISNIRVSPLSEIIGLSGDIARQIKDIPDGEKIDIEFTD
ncbi:MAG: DUF1851 domain-containing protein [Saccharospirillaceae bacterium]|nr:DUF1851 domain-containing protein [Saccharospirillaceae bacterium]